MKKYLQLHIFDIKQIGIWAGDENDSASYLDGVCFIGVKVQFSL